MSSVGDDGSETAINFADLTNCSMKKTGLHTDVFGEVIDPCHPQLQYDISYLSTIQPAWATCVNVGGILWDPPSALTSASFLNSPHLPSPIYRTASPSLTNLASPGAHLSPTPSMTDPPARPSVPKETSVDPLGKASPTAPSHDTPLDPIIQSPSDPPNSADLNTKPNNDAEAGHVADSTVSGAHNAATESTTPTSQDPSAAVTNDPDMPTASSPSVSQLNGAGKDPVEDPSDPSSSRPLVVANGIGTVPKSGATELKPGTYALSAQSPVLTISNTPISLAPEKVQGETSAHPLQDPAPVVSGNLFTLSQESFTLDSHGIGADGTRSRAVTMDGTQEPLKQSELVVGGKMDTFTRTPNHLSIDANGEKSIARTGTGGDAEPSTGTDAGISRALMSTGSGAASPINGSKHVGNGSAAAPFLGIASKMGVGETLWVRAGSLLGVVGYLVIL